MEKLYEADTEHLAELEGARKDAIVAVAVRTPDGCVHSMPQPKRHHDVVHALTKMGHMQSFKDDVQGFVCSNGDFLNRQDALIIATEAGQLIKPTDKPDLYSEDLW